jgi:hypothetical protein
VRGGSRTESASWTNIAAKSAAEWRCAGAAPRSAPVARGPARARCALEGGLKPRRFGPERPPGIRAKAARCDPHARRARGTGRGGVGRLEEADEGLGEQLDEHGVPRVVARKRLRVSPAVPVLRSSAETSGAAARPRAQRGPALARMQHMGV